MDYAVTAQQMKAIDQNIGIPSMVLMERAALAVAEAAEHMAKERNLGKKARILAVCGTGNNGADGVAAGRILQGRGYNVSLLLVGNPEHDSEEMKTQKQIARNLDLAQCTAAEYHVISFWMQCLGLVLAGRSAGNTGRSWKCWLLCGSSMEPE